MIYPSEQAIFLSRIIITAWPDEYKTPWKAMARIVSDVIQHPAVFRSPARFTIQGALERLERQADGLYLYLEGKRTAGRRGEKDEEMRKAVDALLEMVNYMLQTAACAKQVFNDERVLRLKLNELGGEADTEPVRRSFP
jgi:hypothetical protein